ANLYTFAAVPNAAAMWGHLRTTIGLLSVATPSAPFVVAGGAGAGAAWVPRAVQLDDPARAGAAGAQVPQDMAGQAPWRPALGVAAPPPGAPAAAAGAGGAAPGAAAALPAGPGAGAADRRARPLVRDPAGRRQLDFALAAQRATSTPQADWPIKGPRTTQWCPDH
ncbi:unnamed protein product, partial [Prorocentrum cordatum]